MRKVFDESGELCPKLFDPVLRASDSRTGGTRAEE